MDPEYGGYFSQAEDIRERKPDWEMIGRVSGSVLEVDSSQPSRSVGSPISLISKRRNKTDKKSYRVREIGGKALVR